MARTVLLVITMRVMRRSVPRLVGRIVLVVVTVAVLASFPAAPLAQGSSASPANQAPAERRSEIRREFKQAVEAYRKLRKEQEARVGPLPKTSDPAAITRRQHALGDAIRAARAGAHQGDIFTPAVAAMLKGIIAQDLQERGPVDRQAFIVSQPDTTVHVNDFYPTTVPLATVPPRLLAELPVLPDGLEYRFVNGALILRDVDPNLVVDVLPDAVPTHSAER
ncbi:MAG: hypothetical protein ACM3NQ_00395 [Bacteroidales bacterium]